MDIKKHLEQIIEEKLRPMLVEIERLRKLDEDVRKRLKEFDEKTGLRKVHTRGEKNEHHD